MSYNMSRVMLYNMCHVMSCYITRFMLCYIMHLSMLSRRGGRPGVGGGFDVTSLPVAGTFDHSSSPGGRDF